jgi:prepilin-type N-terminal cleavage/methylation domain-containing protein
MRQKGFTLIELLVVISILIVLVMMALPDSARVRARAEDQQMVQRGLALNAAIAEMVADLGPVNAQNTWSGATSDAARYSLLRPYMAYPPPNLIGGTGGAFLYAGYSVVFPGTISNLQTGVIMRRGGTDILSSTGTPFP